MADNPIDEYGDKNAQEVTDELDSSDYSREELIAIRNDEKAGKNRKTVLSALDDELSVTSDDGESDERNPHMDGNYWSDGEVPDKSDIPTVTVYKDSGGAVAGLWFDSEGTKTVKRNRRVDAAIASGKLQIRGN